MLDNFHFKYLVTSVLFVCPRDFLSNSIYFKTHCTFCLMRRFLLSNQRLLQTSSFFSVAGKEGKTDIFFCNSIRL